MTISESKFEDKTGADEFVTSINTLVDELFKEKSSVFIGGESQHPLFESPDVLVDNWHERVRWTDVFFGNLSNSFAFIFKTSVVLFFATSGGAWHSVFCCFTILSGSAWVFLMAVRLSRMYIDGAFHLPDIH